MEEIDIEDDDDLSPKERKNAKLREELEKKQREKRLKNNESKHKHDSLNKDARE